MNSFFTAMCMWNSANRVFLMPSGFTVRLATAIDGTERHYICGRLAA